MLDKLREANWQEKSQMKKVIKEKYELLKGEIHHDFGHAAAELRSARLMAHY